MSRRHNSSRRRNYGKRQHEVRERRAGFIVDRDGQTPIEVDDWQVMDVDEDRHGNGTDSYDGAQL